MQIILGLLFCAFFLIIVWLAAFGYGWHMNAVNGAKYDLASLNQVFTILAAQFSGLIVNHSLLNTEIPWLTTWISGKTAQRIEEQENKEG